MNKLTGIVLTLTVVACGGTTETPASPTDTGNTADTSTGDAAGDGDRSDTPSDAGGIDAACADLAKARCAKLQSCSTFLMKFRYGDAATCEAREKVACVEGLSAPGSGANPTTAAACSAAIAGSTCPQFLGTAPLAACAAKVGALAAGAACAVNGQCATTYCAVPRGSSCGKCAPVPKVGDACSSGEGGEGCGPTLHCGKTSGKCVAFVTGTGACDDDNVCDYGATCVQAKGATAGTCQPFVAAEGGTCDYKTQTAASCDRSLGLWCPSSGAGALKCAKIVNFAKAGETCGLVDTTTYAACIDGANCAIPTGAAGKGTCMGPAANGAACDISGDGAFCLPGSRCIITTDGGVTGTCAAIDGAACK